MNFQMQSLANCSPSIYFFLRASAGARDAFVPGCRYRLYFDLIQCLVRWRSFKACAYIQAYVRYMVSVLCLCFDPFYCRLL